MAPVVPAKRSRPVSKLGDEEAAFPRGGASALTPLEHKQIAIEATRDVLFEQQQGGRSSKQEADGEEESRPKKKLKSKDSKGKKKGAAVAAVPGEEHVKIEGLNYKVCCTNLIYSGNELMIGRELFRGQWF